MVTARTALIAVHVEEREGNLAGVDQSMWVSNSSQSKSNALGSLNTEQADTLNNDMVSE